MIETAKIISMKQQKQRIHLKIALVRYIGRHFAANLGQASLPFKTDSLLYAELSIWQLQLDLFVCVVRTIGSLGIACWNVCSTL